MISASGGSVRGEAEAGNMRKWWQPHIWAGIGFPGWIRLLTRHRFAIDGSWLVNGALITIASVVHTALRGVQQVLYGRRIGRTVIREAPLFIIGHWRTGTTLLHELLSLDERHTSPSTYACMAPNHFLLTERFFSRWLAFLAPAQRPMDDMAAGFDRPQEDEFALCMLGQPSPYWRVAFPNHPPQADDYLDLEDLPPRSRASWKRSLMQFLRELTFRDPRRLILKSPPHSCRIKTLLELFPDARFVHIVRDPYVVFPSTVNLWKTLYASQALQKPTFAGLEEQVLSDCVRLYQKIEEGKKLIRADRFCELRYEDLVRDPVQSMRQLYDCLGLGGFDRFLPRLNRHLAGIAHYRTNGYRLSPRQQVEIALRWGWIIEKYGYEPTPAVENHCQAAGTRFRTGTRPAARLGKGRAAHAKSPRATLKIALLQSAVPPILGLWAWRRMTRHAWSTDAPSNS